MHFYNLFIFAFSLGQHPFFGQLDRPTRCAIYKLGLGHENKNLKPLLASLYENLCPQKRSEMKSMISNH